MDRVPCPACGRACGELNVRCPTCGAPFATGLWAGEAVGAAGSAAGGARARADEPLTGHRIAHFQVHELLGRGGMGEVYRATDVELGRPVALKVLPGEAAGGDEEERLRREARAAAALDHPNVGTVYEVGEHGGRRFIAMAFYDGETLASRLARGPLPVAEALDLARQLAAALAAAHRAGVVHRDVKPGNVMLAGGRVKLLDFGIARRPGVEATTASGVTAGTLAYMAPEQVRGDAVDRRADLWALGVVLHEMLSGSRPFSPSPGRGLASAILGDDPPRLEALRPEAPPAVAALVRRCLAKDPAARPASAEEVLAGLDDLQGALGTASVPVSVAGAPGGRRPARGLAAALGGLALAAAVAAGFVAARRPAPPAGGPGGPGEHLVVGVLEPRVEGAAPEEAALVAANLHEAALRGLTALEGVVALDPGQLRGLSGTPAEVARAVAADELVSAEATCAADLCEVVVRRLAGADGRVLRTASLRLPPSNPRAFAEGVAVGVRRDWPERGLRFAGLGLEVADEDYDRYLEIRARLNARERPTAAMLEELGGIRRRAPGFVEAAFLESSLARYLYVAGGEARFLERGLAVARTTEARAPADPRPAAARFDLALAARRLDEAEAALARLEALEPGSASHAQRRARLLEARGEPEAALALLSEVARRQPSWQYLLMLANLEYRQGRLAEARGTLERLLERSPGNAEARRTLAQLELLDGDPARAVELLRRLAAGSADRGDLANLGLALLLLRRYEEAEASFRRAYELAPGEPQIALNLADCLQLLGRDAEAATLYREVVAATAGAEAAALWTALSARAQALAHLGRGPEAVEAAQRALRLGPDNPQVALEAAVVYAVLGERSSALAHAERALASGVDRRWFGLPWFDGLGTELAALRGSRQGPATR